MFVYVSYDGEMVKSNGSIEYKGVESSQKS